MFRVVSLNRRGLTGFLLGFALLTLTVVAVAGAAPSASPTISAHLDESVFTRSQASSIRLVYRFAKPSKRFSYRLNFKKGQKWQPVKSVSRKGHFRGQKKMSVKTLFAGKPINAGNYRLKIASASATKLLFFRVAKTSAYASPLAAGDYHSCAVVFGGKIKCWGYNSSGQLGDGTTTNRAAPVLVKGISNAAQVSAGESHSCALLSNHTLKCWGAGYFGQLGDGSTGSSSIPVKVSGISDARQVSANGSTSCALLSNRKVKCWGNIWDGGSGESYRPTPFQVRGVSDAVQVSAGGCAVLSSGAIKCWGNNMVGELGNGSDVPGSSAAVKVSKISNAIQVSAGGNHTCAVLADGTVECWGGVNPCINMLNTCLDPAAATWSKVPVRMPEVSNAIEVVSPDYSCVVLSSGGVKCWGWNTYFGEYGHPAAAYRVSDISKALHLGLGRDHSCALVRGGKIECWGDHRYGQLGNGWATKRLVPVAVKGISSIAEISAGSTHTCARLSSGAVRCWGQNLFGELGNGTEKASFVPTQVSGISTAAQVSAGDSHSCALLANGTIKCWGSSFYGALGNGEIGYDAQSASPVEVRGISSAVQISAGWLRTCALLCDHTIKCWGNGLGLGNGSNANSPLPVIVTGISNATQLALGGQASHACALLSGGTIKCWGYNGYGQLGDGTNANRNTPVQVGGISSAVQISVGGDHSCAVLSDHTVRCWGSDTAGQLGDGEVGYSSSKSAPVEVIGISNAVQVVTGDSHTCALLTDRTIRCWGSGNNGQLGDGKTAHGSSDSNGRDVSTAPVVVANISNALRISAGGSGNGFGSNYSCALLGDGSAKCWGDNYSGQLGNGEAGYSLVPIEVIGIP